MGICISHRTPEGRDERVVDHLREVAEMASGFARAFGAEAQGHTAGKYHDIGKYSREFQRRILDGGPKTDHSTAGAWELFKQNMPLLAYCVAGHHGGLPDGGTPADAEGSTLFSRMYKAHDGVLPNYSAYLEDIKLVNITLTFPSNMEQSSEIDLFAFSFSARMIFSCLVDADFLCTERFMNGVSRCGFKSNSMNVLLERLEEKLSAFYPPKTVLNKTRCKILESCANAASSARGVFSLTVPTGGGKTYASLNFALKHAINEKNNMRRIIYVAPYTAIIEQNAKVFRDVFGKENVLEHHANFDFDDLGDLGNRLRLASENWDCPIIVTTTVQLFESLFSNKPSKCRKLHNIAKSVIVLDEAQALPTQQLQPCVRVLSELVLRYGCSVLLCTATQPSLNVLFEQYGCKVREIVSGLQELYKSLKRVEYRYIGKIDDDSLAAQLSTCEQVLCVVNSRKQARNVFELLCGLCGIKDQVGWENHNGGENGGIFHLSTLMHPAHRKETLSKIRALLKAGKPCCVVSTSLIEAGVDIDFPATYRALAGIDSMVQCAGRCNREGIRSATDSKVVLFEPLTNYALPKDIEQKSSIAKSVMIDALGKKFADAQDDSGVVCDIGKLDLIKSYFDQLIDLRSDNLDARGVLRDLSEFQAFPFPNLDIFLPSIPFADAASKFRIIAEGSHPVVVPELSNENDLYALRHGFASIETMRRLGRYTVNLYDNDIKALGEAIRLISGDTYELLDKALYRGDIGLDVSDAGGRGLFI